MPSCRLLLVRTGFGLIGALANANFSDCEGESSFVNTDIAGTSISTSRKLGYRWPNGFRSWMYGINAVYDSRSMNTGDPDTSVNVKDKRDVLFSQVAEGLEAVSESFKFNT